MRIIGIDYGQKRVGVAMSDPLGITSQPLPFIPNDKNMFPQLKKLVEENQVQEIVVGLPITMKGTSSEMTIEAEKFAEDLKKHVSIPVILQDERLSTMESEKLLISADVSRKKRKEVRDSMAASIILQDYLERKGL
ncbi:MAG: Holliday junction resolvase RuvX [Bdellovibrionota bacterium]